MNYSKRFGVEPGSKVDLAKVDASFKDKHESHAHALPESRQRGLRVGYDFHVTHT